MPKNLLKIWKSNPAYFYEFHSRALDLENRVGFAPLQQKHSFLLISIPFSIFLLEERLLWNVKFLNLQYFNDLRKIDRWNQIWKFSLTTHCFDLRTRNDFYFWYRLGSNKRAAFIYFSRFYVRSTQQHLQIKLAKFGRKSYASISKHFLTYLKAPRRNATKQLNRP